VWPLLLHRIVIQAAPPFLVVHANAAFTRLTGVDSHEVNGRTISNLFTIPHPASRQSSCNDGVAMSHQAAAAAGRARAQDESVGLNVERLVIANGFDDYHIINVASKSAEGGAAAVQCRISISPVIARSMPTVESTAVVTDTNQEPHHHKRRKHHHAHHHEGHNAAAKHRKPAATTQRTSQLNIITHYVIQLEKLSLENTKMEAATEGSTLLNKLEHAHQYDREMLDADVEETLDETSQSTDPKEPIEAVG